MVYNEADTCAKLITPSLYQSGWDEQRLKREQFFTDGRIYLVGDEYRRRKGKKADYLLYHTLDMPLAVVEAKDETHSPGDGIQQAKDYAEILGLRFAYSTNGHGVEEFDFITNQQRALATFPSPQELWQRYQVGRWTRTPDSIHERPEKPYMVFSGDRDPLLFPYNRQGGKSPRYYQEVAIRNVVQSIMNGQRRMLLTMATGTGKTYVSFQIVWKLVKTGLAKRVLFLADRNILRDQAYRTFAAFEDARDVVAGKVDLNRQVYFGIYQAMYGTEAGQRLFLDFPPDFFDLVIIDECHRSGFGTWNEILKHFSSAIHLGMTATPKREDNIDSYEYFCKENGGRPVYEYNMGQAIEDGFLATYRVHRVLTNLDKVGLSVQDAKTQGAEFFVPSGADLRDEYQLPQFEREIVLPDRTKVICNHLASLLRQFGPMQKTIVFCVTMDHALDVARELQNSLGKELGISDYAQRIVSAERNVDDYLERFRSSENRTPVIATTADLLETGVDIPSVKNIVFLKTIGSNVVFKQIVGRGSRLDKLTDKYWFRIIDYTNASRLFESWDRPDDVQPAAKLEGPRESILRGIVVSEETGQPVADILVTVLLAPNEQIQCRTNSKGEFNFSELPAGKVTLFIQANKDFSSRQIALVTTDDADQVSTISILPIHISPIPPVKGQGVKVFVAEETYLELDATGKRLTILEYLNHAAKVIQTYTSNVETLRAQWINRKTREILHKELSTAGIDPAVLAIALKSPDADAFDILAHIAYHEPVRSRDERAHALETQQQSFLDSYGPLCREVIIKLIDMYRLGGVDTLEHLHLFNTPPFAQMGFAPGAAHRCGGAQRLRQAIDQLENNLYQL